MFSFHRQTDISENLFKLQIGGQKHWNVYTKSFLSFGHVSARQRHLLAVADATLAKQQSAAEVPSALSYCLHAGYTEIVTGTPRTLPPPNGNSNSPKYSKSSNIVPFYENTQVEISGPAGPAADQFDRCLKALRPLLEKDHGHFCMLVYDGECSIDGAYQPILPDDGRFIGTSSYILPWEILVLPDTASLELYRSRAENICSMSFNDVLQYYEMKSLVDSDSKLAEMLPYFCFLSSYAYVLLVGESPFHTRQGSILPCSYSSFAICLKCSGFYSVFIEFGLATVYLASCHTLPSPLSHSTRLHSPSRRQCRWIWI